MMLSALGPVEQRPHRWCAQSGTAVGTVDINHALFRQLPGGGAQSSTPTLVVPAVATNNTARCSSVSTATRRRSSASRRPLTAAGGPTTSASSTRLHHRRVRRPTPARCRAPPHAPAARSRQRQRANSAELPAVRR